MKFTVSLFSVSVVLLSGVVQAQQLVPVPDMHIPDIPYADTDVGDEIGQPMTVDSTTFIDPVVYTGALFTRVKYTDLREKAPGAVTKIITVKNPCRHRGCNEPETVCIEICVPPCGCETVKCRLFGNRIRYDYGKYAVDVRIKRDYIQVDYQD
jgi:hypothetical protein